MMTLRRFVREFESVPASTSWYLADLGEARGRQELFTRQSPQRLKALREHALIESAVSSNRIEGVEVDQARIATIVFGVPLLRDRDEEKVHAIDRTFGPLSIAELQNACPNVSLDMIRRVLKNLRAENRVECLGRGQNAHWVKIGKWESGNTQ